jgi:transcriptional regulator with XRE-family HTH domain
VRKHARNPRGSWTSCHVTLRGQKSRPGVPETPRTLGEHLRRVRLDRGLWQKQVAREIGCSKASLLNWEKGHAEPELRFLPAILRFLGYDPRPEPATLGGRIRAAREAAGLSERELARRLGLDPGTLAAWERDEVRRPYPRIRRVFERWLSLVGAECAAYGSVNSAAGSYQERR